MGIAKGVRSPSVDAQKQHMQQDPGTAGASDHVGLPVEAHKLKHKCLSLSVCREVRFIESGKQEAKILYGFVPITYFAPNSGSGEQKRSE